jgi:hypothetical protein
MVRKTALNSRQVLMDIGEYRKRLRSALQAGEDYALLHADILRFLKIVYITKSEYKDVAVYPQPPEIREVVIMATDEKGESAELERRSTYSENELIRSRLELGERLQNLLAELEAEYELRKKLEATCETSLKNDLQNLKKEVSLLKSKLSQRSNQKTR